MPKHQFHPTTPVEFDSNSLTSFAFNVVQQMNSKHLEYLVSFKCASTTREHGEDFDSWPCLILDMESVQTKLYIRIYIYMYMSYIYIQTHLRHCYVPTVDIWNAAIHPSWVFHHPLRCPLHVKRWSWDMNWQDSASWGLPPTYPEKSRGHPFGFSRWPFRLPSGILDLMKLYIFGRKIRFRPVSSGRHLFRRALMLSIR